MGSMTREYNRQYRESHREDFRRRNREWRERNPERARASTFAATYGMTLEEALEIRAAKPEACEICGRVTKLHYDHDHATEAHRGWLCGPCNRGLGTFDDDPARLRAAADYLERI